jgi:ATP/maltotriose-dependent transcriptional regulator MalT/DNA-binding SARP family transcriptional activator
VAVFPLPAGPGYHATRPARFTVPRTAPDILERPRLTEFIQRHLNRRLILISAAPGYGKTSLAVSFAHQADFPLAWLSLDETDRDIVTMVSDLFQSLHRALLDWMPPPPESLGLPSAASQPVSLGLALTQALDQAATDFTALVIDDFHLVDDSPTIIEFFDSFFETLPPQLHVILLSRQIPPLRIASLAARQEIAGLSEEHLRFTPSEVQALLEKRNNLTLPMSDAETLVSHTEGWITGILLSSQLIWRGLLSNVGLRREQESMLYDYLAEEVLEQQPQDLRTFLLEASVLPEMDSAACDVVLGRQGDSARMLEQLEAKRLFITAVGDPQPTYRFHHLFREFLQARLRQKNPLRLQHLQRRAAEQYEQSGMPEAAFNLYVACGDLARAGSMAEANAQGLFESGRREILLQWAKQLEQISLEVPRLQYWVGRAQCDRGEIEVAQEAADLAQSGFERRSDKNGLTSVELINAWLSFLKSDYRSGLTRALAVLGRAEGEDLPLEMRAIAERYAGRCELELGRPQEALDHLRRASSWFAQVGNEYSHAQTLTDLALVLRVLGKTAEVSQTQQQVLSVWRKLGVPGQIAVVLNNVGYDMHMLGQYQSARAVFEEALEWARKSGERHAQAVVLISQADLLRDLGDNQLASDLYSVANKLAQEAGDTVLLSCIYWGMASINRTAGNYPASLEWLRRADLAVGASEEHSSPLNQALRGAVLGEMGDRDQALKSLRKAVQDLEVRGGDFGNLSWASLLLARALWVSGAMAEAETQLGRSFELARMLGYDQMLVREAIACREFLSTIGNSEELGVQVRSLLVRAENLPPSGRGKQELREGVNSSVVDVNALGPARVVIDGREIPRTEWVSQRARELLFFLVDKTSVPRDELLAVFWPEAPQGRALTNLYQTLYRIRRALGGEVVVLRDQICQLAENLEVRYDVAVFEEAANRALALPYQDLRRIGALEHAVDLYLGDYLAYLPVEWARQRREELSELYVRVLREYADELVVLTRYSDARGVLGRALAVEPLQDDLHQRMMRVLAAQGRIHEVVEHYQHYCESLRREMGLDPPPETRSLYGSLIA